MFEEVLGDSFSVFFKNIKRYALLATVIMVPLILLQIAFLVGTEGTKNYESQVSTFQMLKHIGDADAMQQYTEDMKDKEPASPMVMFISFIVIALGGILANSATVLATDYYYQEKDVTIGDIIKQSARKWPGLIGMAFIIMLVSTIGFVFLIVPGIFLLVKYSLALPLYVMEDISVPTALSRSFHMTKGKFWTIFGTIFVLWMVIMLAGWIAQLILMLPAMVISSIVVYIIMTVFSALVQVLCSGFLAIAAYLFYAKISGRMPTKGKLEPAWEIGQ